MNLTTQLFSNNPWSLVAAEQRRRLEEEVSSMDEEMLLHTPIHELSNYLAQKYRTSVPVLRKDQVSIAQRPVQIDLNHDPLRLSPKRARPQWAAETRVEVSVPFEGDPACFQMQPTTFTFHPPQGDIDGNKVIFQIEGVALGPDIVRARIQQSINEISKNLRYLQTDVNRFNGNLYSYANLLIERQRKKVLSDPDAPTAGFRLKERGEALAAPPDERHELTPPLPPIITNQPGREPLLAVQDYEEILQTFQQIARTLRHSPSALAVMDELTLRSHFLISLNARFESRNARETFTSTGDAELGIRIESSYIFMAACHFWAGASVLEATLDHLLAADAWRDAKAAIVLFNRRPPFASMLDMVRATIRQHSSFKRELPQLSDTTFLYALSSRAPDNRTPHNRELLLTVLAFDVP